MTQITFTIMIVITNIGILMDSIALKVSAIGTENGGLPDVVICDISAYHSMGILLIFPRASNKNATLYRSDIIEFFWCSLLGISFVNIFSIYIYLYEN